MRLKVSQKEANDIFRGLFAEVQGEMVNDYWWDWNSIGEEILDIIVVADKPDNPNGFVLSVLL